MESPRSLKREGEDIENLRSEEKTLTDQLRVAKKRLKAGGSFNTAYWTQSTEIEDLLCKRDEVERKISLGSYEGTKAEWEKTEEAKQLFEKIRSREVSKKLAQKQQGDLEQTSKKRALRSSFMKLFTTSKMGLGIKDTGAGKRPRKAQENFRSEMIEVYKAQHPEQREWIWCPILAQWLEKKTITAAHLFAWMHGQDTMDAIFGKTAQPELFSPRNGLLISSAIEKQFDCGKLVIVPDLPERPKAAELLAWMKGEVREYKIKIIDKTWDRLNKRIVPFSDMKFKDLDGKRLQFRSDFRPAARYLYFHYCLQVLRQAWQHDKKNEADVVLRSELGKPFWGTPGRYLPKNMLLSLVEELGHEYKDLLEGASSGGGDDNLLLDVASNQVRSRSERRKSLADSGFGDEMDSDESESESDESESEGVSH